MSYKVYECRWNSDQTEGRGVTRTYHTTLDLDEAVKRVKGQGPMGCSDGDIYEVTYASSPDEFVGSGPVISSVRIYGSRKRPDGKHDDGFLDFRDLTIDPEWNEYVRLARKFKDARF